MSIIIAVTKNGTTVMAADSLNVFGQERISTENSKAIKVRRVGSALFAFSGWSVYDNIIEHVLAGKDTPRLDDSEHIFNFFLELWRHLHDQYQFVNDQCREKDSPFGDLDASFLIANRAGIFKVSQDVSVCRFDQYYAIGSGAYYALGALHQIYDQVDGAAEIARRGVESAIEFDVYCGGEIDLFEVK